MTYLENWGSGARHIMDLVRRKVWKLQHGLLMVALLLLLLCDLISHLVQ